VSTTGRIELAIAPSNPNVLYSGIQMPPNGGSTFTGLLGLYRTDNAWAATPAWIQVPTGPTGTGGYCGPIKCGYAHVLSVNPADANMLFAGGGEQGFWRCSNCGASPTWANVATDGIHPDHHALAWAGSRLIDGSDGGIWSTLNLGASWQNHNATLTTNMFMSGALHPTARGKIVAGFRDFSLAVRTASGTWSFVPISALVGRELGRGGGGDLVESS
jgi:hypothetical protein